MFTVVFTILSLLAAISEYANDFFTSGLRSMGGEPLPRYKFFMPNMVRKIPPGPPVCIISYTSDLQIHILMNIVLMQILEYLFVTAPYRFHLVCFSLVDGCCKQLSSLHWIHWGTESKHSYVPCTLSTLYSMVVFGVYMYIRI